MSQPGGHDTDQKPAMANEEAEAALLGALMIDNRLIPAAAEKLTPGDFYATLHERMFGAILRLHAAGKEHINPITLKPIFENDPEIRLVGGVGYLATLTGSAAALVGALSFADQIAELAARRRLAESLEQTIERLQDGSVELDLEELAGQVQQSVGEALERQEPVKPASAADMVDIVIDRAARVQDEGARVGATCRSITDLNKLFGVFEPGTLIIGAGRPGMGKTVLGLSAAWGFAANGHPTEYFHAEMTREQLAMRLTADVSHGMGSPVPHKSIRLGDLSIIQRRDLEQVREKVRQLPFRTTPIPDASVAQLDAKIARSCQRWERQGRKLEVVVVDYLQLLQAHDARGRLIDRDTERVNAVSSALRRITSKYGIVMIALSQLSRAVEARADRRPQMSDLRDSGRLEQDADGVLLLYREEVYLEKDEPKQGTKEHEAWEIDLAAARGRVDLILGKWRHGMGRTRQAKFFGDFYAIRGGDFYPEDQQDLLL